MGAKRLARSTAVLVVAALGTLLRATAAYAQGPAYLVKDINTVEQGSHPSDLINVNGTAYFFADDGNGWALWRSDGTAGGTVLVKPIKPKGAPGSSPYDLIDATGTLYFFADDGTESALWRSDGTPDGTARVTDVVNTANFHTAPFNLISVNGALFFLAGDANGLALWRSDGTDAGTLRVVGDNRGFVGYLTSLDGTLLFEAQEAQEELWRSDGTEAGTRPIKGITLANDFSGFTLANGTLFFAADDGTHGNELWKSDGTEAGTVLVKDLAVGAASSSPYNLTNVNGTLYFTISFFGSAVWRSDGSDAGTAAVSYFPATSVLSNLTAVEGKLFFTDGGDLWHSDGTEASTILVKSLGSYLTSLTDVNGVLFFGIGDANGRELWRSDGTEGGTTQVRDINPGPPDSNPSNLLAVNGTLFFAADDGTSGVELWRSDGTGTGTLQIENINRGNFGSDPGPLIDVNGTLLFFIPGPPDSYPGSGSLWKSDGTEAGTVRLSPDGADLLQPFGLGVVRGGLTFFTGNYSGQPTLWGSDGTVAGTLPLLHLHGNSPSPYIGDQIYVDGTLFFAASWGGPPDSYMLWKSDGTAAGTVLLAGSAPDSVTDHSLYDVESPINVGGTLFFVAADFDHGRELWKSDGAAGGAQMLKDINPGSAASSPRNFTSASKTLFFIADGASGPELWKSDGSELGTVMLKDFAGSYPDSLTAVNGRLFFTVATVAGGPGPQLWSSDGTESGTLLVNQFAADVGLSPLGQIGPTLLLVVHRPTGTDLWGTDGTAAGTMLLKNLNGFDLQHVDSDPQHATTASGVLFFTAGDDTHGRELWRSDGTPAGTGLVKDINAGPGSSLPSVLINVGGTLYFTATDESNRSGLWKSDGSEAGTVRVHDFLSVGQLTNLNGTLIFPADDGTTGFEPWISDGTTAGTVRIQDIAPGRASSNPYAFVKAGSHLFFAADDISHGQELWAMPLATVPTPTFTPTPPAVTATAILTPPPSLCVGDCNGTRAVAINDLITLVNIALGTTQPSACPNGVPSGANVNVALLIQAVNNALSSCGSGQ